MAEQIDKLLSQKEVAAWIGMSEAYLEMARFKKTGIPFVKIGKSCRYRTSDIQRFINDHLVGSEI